MLRGRGYDRDLLHSCAEAETTKDDVRSLWRAKVRSCQDSKEGWATIKGNQGTEYLQVPLCIADLREEQGKEAQRRTSLQTPTHSLRFEGPAPKPPAESINICSTPFVPLGKNH